MTKSNADETWTRRQWRLRRLRSEPTCRITENENKENETCSGMKHASAAIIFICLNYILWQKDSI